MDDNKVNIHDTLILPDFSRDNPEFKERLRKELLLYAETLKNKLPEEALEHVSAAGDIYAQNNHTI